MSRLVFLSLALLLCGPARLQAAADGPLPPAEAVARMKLPPGFQATLFAGEPDLHQPIAFTFDDRGRLWVVECYSYPHPLAEKKDRVLIFEDRDRDGHFDSRKVFWDQGNNLTGIELGFGGVWLCSTPNLIFIPDRDGDDAPTARPTCSWTAGTSMPSTTCSTICGGDPTDGCTAATGFFRNRKSASPAHRQRSETAINCGVVALSSRSIAISKSLPMGPRIPGAWISMILGRCSSPTVSSTIYGTWSVAPISSACTARTSIPTCTI